MSATIDNEIKLEEENAKLKKQVKGLTKNLSVVEIYLKEINAEDCTEGVWYIIENALEFAEVEPPTTIGEDECLYLTAMQKKITPKR